MHNSSIQGREAGAPLLAVTDLTAGYGAVTVVKDVSLQIGHGEFVCILGANGVGKTTLLRSLVGETHVRSGSVTLDGRELAGRPPHQVSRGGIAVVPEGRALVPDLTVRENLLLGSITWNRRYRSPALDEALELEFERFPILGKRVDQLAGSLSGGEQQMLAISRALLMKPRLLLLDEPSLGLAPLIVKQVFDDLKNAHAAGLTILMAEQNATAALRVADRALLMSGGRLVRDDKAEDVASSAEVGALFFGEKS